LGVIIRFFFQFSRESESPIASASMEQSTLQVTRWLQRSLSETNLQSIRSLPNDGGVAMESPRDLNDNLCFTGFGTVLWKKFIFFQVKKGSSTVALPPKVLVGSSQITPAVGELEYDEDTSGVAAEPGGPAALTPSGVSARHRVLSNNFLIDTTGNLMGCSVYYPDASGNPQAFTATQRGEPVCVALTLMDLSGRTGKPTVRKLLMQVKPEN
jgi:hypothetical protein